MNSVNDRDKRFEETMSEIANAIQTAGLLASLQRRDAGALTQDAVKLEAAIERATGAMQQLRRYLAGPETL
jgi:hypothetical protein